ncbi:DUF1127 domain-containing protein [Sulfitobacter sp. LCG007]
MSMSDSHRVTRAPRSRVMDLWKLMSLSRSRTALGELDARMLDDIGVSEEEARREASRPFWDAPSAWMRK